MTTGPEQVIVSAEEWLARFIVRKHHVRLDGSVKPHPFIPSRHVELSVTRHLGLAEDGLKLIWLTLCAWLAASGFA